MTAQLQLQPQPPAFANHTGKRVAVLEDNRHLRRFLADLITHSGVYQLVGAFETAEFALAALATARPDVILTDLGLPGLDGEVFIRRVREVSPGTRCLVLTIQDNSDALWRVLQIGASGYLIKPSTPHKILESIQEVLDGGAPMSPSIARQVLLKIQAQAGGLSGPSPDAVLTPAESRVLELLASGMVRKQIAEQLGASVRTIACHLTHIYEKIRVENQVQAANWYNKHRGAAPE